MNNIRYYLLAIIQSLMIGFSFLFAKTAIADSNPLKILSQRFILALVFTVIYLFITGYSFRNILRKFQSLILLTLLYPVGFFLFQFLGLTRISSAESGILFATVPIATLIFSSLFLKIKAAPIQIIGSALSVTGVMLILYMNGVRLSPDPLGYFYTFLSVICSALYFIVTKKSLKDHEPKDILLIMMLSGALIFNLINAFLSPSNHTVSTYIKDLFSGLYRFDVLYLGIFASVLSPLFSTIVLKHLSPAKVSIFSNLSTLTAVVTGAFLLNEPIKIYHWVGTLMILSGIIIMTGPQQAFLRQRAKNPST